MKATSTDICFVEKGTGLGSCSKFLMPQTFDSGRIQTWIIRPLQTLGSHLMLLLTGSVK